MKNATQHGMGSKSTSRSATILIQSGEALFGEFWKRQLSEALGYAPTCSSLRRWIDGETDLPILVEKTLYNLLCDTQNKVAAILSRIEDQLDEQKKRPITGKFEEFRNAENLKNLEEVGLLLFGEMWEKALASCIGYSRWGIRAWKQKKRNTPEVLPWLLCRYLEQRIKQIDDAKHIIEKGM